MAKTRFIVEGLSPSMEVLKHSCFPYVALALLAFAVHASAQTVPKGFTVPDDTVSPDKHYGVTVPVLAEHDYDDKTDRPVNSLFDLKTGQMVTAIQSGSVGWDRMGHGEVLPARWSPDGSILVWQVDGKWSDSVLVVMKLVNEKVAWQTNVLKLGERAILERTKKAAPKKYALVKKTNGSFAGGVDDPTCAYPDGFSIEVDAVEPVAFPMQITAELTSETKPGTPMYGVLDSHLTGVLDAKGRFTVTSFHLGYADASHFKD